MGVKLIKLIINLNEFKVRTNRWANSGKKIIFPPNKPNNKNNGKV